MDLDEDSHPLTDESTDASYQPEAEAVLLGLTDVEV
jgi:hypothetical protein